MIITVASGKGGTGKTTVSVNLARLAANQGRQVHLCDCDVEEPNAHLYLDLALDSEKAIELPLPVVDQELCNHCGQCAHICEFNAIASLPSQTVVFPELCHSCSGCWLVCPEKAIGQGVRSIGTVSSGRSGSLRFTQGLLKVGETQVPPLVEAVCAVAEQERDENRPAAATIILRDAPPGAACPAVASLSGSDFVVLVAEPTAFGMNDLQVAVSLVRDLGLPFAVTVNRVGSGDDRVQEYCLDEGIHLLPGLPYSGEAARVVSEGGLLVDRVPELRAAFTTLLDALLERAREVVS